MTHISLFFLRAFLDSCLHMKRGHLNEVASFHVQALYAIEVHQSINVLTNGSQNLTLWVLLQLS